MQMAMCHSAGNFGAFGAAVAKERCGFLGQVCWLDVHVEPASGGEEQRKSSGNANHESAPEVNAMRPYACRNGGVTFQFRRLRAGPIARETGASQPVGIVCHAL